MSKNHRRWDEKILSKLHKRDVIIHKFQIPLIIFFAIAAYYLLPEHPVSISDYFASITVMILGSLSAASLMK